MIQVFEPFQSKIKLHIGEEFLQDLWDRYVPVSSDAYEKISLIYLNGGKERETETVRPMQQTVNMTVRNIITWMDLRQNPVLFNCHAVNQSIRNSTHYCLEQLKRSDRTMYRFLKEQASRLEQEDREDLRYQEWARETKAVEIWRQEYRLLEQVSLQIQKKNQEFSAERERQAITDMIQKMSDGDYKRIAETFSGWKPSRETETSSEPERRIELPRTRAAMVHWLNRSDETQVRLFREQMTELVSEVIRSEETRLAQMREARQTFESGDRMQSDEQRNRESRMRSEEQQTSESPDWMRSGERQTSESGNWTQSAQQYNRESLVTENGQSHLRSLERISEESQSHLRSRERVSEDGQRNPESQNRIQLTEQQEPTDGSLRPEDLQAQQESVRVCRQIAEKLREIREQEEEESGEDIVRQVLEELPPAEREFAESNTEIRRILKSSGDMNQNVSRRLVELRENIRKGEEGSLEKYRDVLRETDTGALRDGRAEEETVEEAPYTELAGEAGSSETGNAENSAAESIREMELREWSEALLAYAGDGLEDDIASGDGREDSADSGYEQYKFDELEEYASAELILREEERGFSHRDVKESESLWRVREESKEQALQPAEVRRQAGQADEIKLTGETNQKTLTGEPQQTDETIRLAQTDEAEQTGYIEETKQYGQADDTKQFDYATEIKREARADGTTQKVRTDGITQEDREKMGSLLQSMEEQVSREISVRTGRDDFRLTYGDSILQNRTVRRMMEHVETLDAEEYPRFVRELSESVFLQWREYQGSRSAIEKENQPDSGEPLQMVHADTLTESSYSVQGEPDRRERLPGQTIALAEGSYSVQGEPDRSEHLPGQTVPPTEGSYLEQGESDRSEHLPGQTVTLTEGSYPGREEPNRSGYIPGAMTGTLSEEDRENPESSRTGNSCICRDGEFGGR